MYSMASTGGEAGNYKAESRHRVGQQVALPSSQRTQRRSWSANSSPSCAGEGSAAGAPKCVCAPPTHAGSFKCRLHRVKHSRVLSAAPLREAPPHQQLPAPDAANGGGRRTNSS